MKSCNKNVTQTDLNEKFEKIRTILKILTGVSYIGSLLLLLRINNYSVFPLLLVLTVLFSFSLYVKYNDIISLAELRRHRLKNNDFKINITGMFSLASIGLAVSAFYFHFVSYKTLIIWSVIIFITIIFIFFKYTCEYKIKKSAIVVILISALCYAPGAIVQINYIFDYSEPTVAQNEILDMRINRSRRGPDSYLVKITDFDNKVIELNVSRTYYSQLSTGDKVTVVKKEGFLKIGYIYIDEK